MTNREVDFLKIRRAIGSVTPKQLGQLMSQYYERYMGNTTTTISAMTVGVSVEKKETLDLFDGNVLGLEKS